MSPTNTCYYKGHSTSPFDRLVATVGAGNGTDIDGELDKDGVPTDAPYSLGAPLSNSIPPYAPSVGAVPYIPDTRADNDSSWRARLYT